MVYYALWLRQSIRAIYEYIDRAHGVELQKFPMLLWMYIYYTSLPLCVTKGRGILVCRHNHDQDTKYLYRAVHSATTQNDQHGCGRLEFYKSAQRGIRYKYLTAGGVSVVVAADER